MGESSDPSETSDESIEVAERSDDQSTGAFGGSGTNVSNDFSNSPNQGGFSSTQAQADYNAQQTALSNAINAGISPTEVGRSGINDLSGLSAFGGRGGASSTQSTAGDQSVLGDMLGGSMSITDPNTGQTTTYSPDQVPQLELMAPIGYDPFNMRGKINSILQDRDARGLYTEVTRDSRGNVTGAFDTNNVLGFDVTTYTGLDDNPYNEDLSYMDGDGNPTTTPPISNPITGKEQCPDGYVFDSDLQACRLKTRADDAVGTPKNPPDMNAPAFTRNYSLLNTAPSNLPQGFDYNQANQNFMSRFATRPSIFKQPPNLLGFTPFRSS